MGGFDQYETTRTTHAGDLVQKCAYFKAMRPIDVFRVLLEDGAGIDTAYIPYSDWLTRGHDMDCWIPHHAPRVRPGRRQKAFDELVPGKRPHGRSGGTRKAAKYSTGVSARLTWTEIIAELNDDQNIISGSVRCWMTLGGCSTRSTSPWASATP